MIQIALFKCSTSITNIWLTPQVKFKSCTTNRTPCQDFCMEVAPGPRVVRLCPRHTPGSCWDDAVGGRRAEAFGAYKILIENSVVWASNSVDLTTGILLNFFLLGRRHVRISDFFPLWVKFQVCRALKGPGGTQKFKYQWDAAGSRAVSLSASPSAPGSYSSRSCEHAEVQLWWDVHCSWGRGRLLSLGCFHGDVRVACMCHCLHCSRGTVKIPKSLKSVGIHTEMYL